MQLDPDLRIAPLNAPVLTLPESHPARQTLIAHAVCAQDCAGREIQWPDSEWVAVDQEWTSVVDGKRWTFSGMIYSFVCFDLVLHGWINHPPHLTDDEIGALAGLPKVFVLLAECESAAAACENHVVIHMVTTTRTFFSLWEMAIRLRIHQDHLQVHA